MLRAILTSLLYWLNLMLWGTLVFLGGLVRLLIPPRRRRGIILVLAAIADRWVAGNDRITDTMLPTKWEIEEVPGLKRDGRYLVLANHISWLDILVIFRAFHGKTAFVRFFLKSELLWFPILGQACWGLEFPFMKRHSPEYLAKHPEKRGEDLETTRRAARRYAKIPVTILNFVEGTRFSEKKRDAQQSPYRHLLRPRAGGVSFTLASMGENLDGVIDVTIAYPGHQLTMWDFLCGRVPRVVVKARRVEVPAEFFDKAVTEPGPIRDRFKEWLDRLWKEKDALIEQSVAEVSG
jgi:1-acyl-sn-glycerol-3-phosphate acyltransferase